MNELESVDQSLHRRGAKMRYVLWRYQPPWIIRLDGHVLTATARLTRNSMWFVFGHTVDEFEQKLAKAHVELKDALRADKPPEGI